MKDVTEEQSDGLRGHCQLFLESALMSGNVGNERTHVLTTTRHLTTSSDEMVTVDLRFERAAWQEYSEIRWQNMFSHAAPSQSDASV